MKGETFTMQLYLLRHGAAEDIRPGMTDADRALTMEGRRKLRQVLRTALEAQVKPTLILTSPLKRAMQTAEIAKRVLRCKTGLLQTNALLPSANVEQVWDEIRAHQQEAELMLVGHNPQFENLTSYLLASPELRIDFKKGAIVHIELPNLGLQPKGVLRWYLTGKLASAS